MEKINLIKKLDLIKEHWSPKIVGEVNDVYIKLVKFKGDFIWHFHEEEDIQRTCRNYGHTWDLQAWEKRDPSRLFCACGTRGSRQTRAFVCRNRIRYVHIF